MSNPGENLPDPLVADGRRLAAMLQFGLRTVRTLDSMGKLPPPIRIGGRVVWRIAEIEAWLDAGTPDRATWIAIRDSKKY
jgi:predicted DNA-binding transcriptional regulator AlpA